MIFHTGDIPSEAYSPSQHAPIQALGYQDVYMLFSGCLDRPCVAPAGGYKSFRGSDSVIHTTGQVVFCD
jgi:hypothetical protein